MKLYTAGSTDSTECFSMFLLWTTMRHVQKCISYVQPSLCHVCIMYKHVYTIMNASISFIQCSDRVYTRIYRYLYVCLCAYMFRPCIYHVHTWHVQFHFAMNKKYKKEKILQRAGYEPTIVCITASCLNHYTSSMLASYRIVTVYVYCFTWLGHLESVEVGYSDIFLEYSIYLTTRSICLEYSDIYLEYVNPFPIPGICLEYAWHILSESFQVYVWNIPDIYHAFSFRVIW